MALLQHDVTLSANRMRGRRGMVGAALNRTFGQWRLFISSKVFLLFYDFFSREIASVLWIPFSFWKLKKNHFFLHIMKFWRNWYWFPPFLCLDTCTYTSSEIIDTHVAIPTFGQRPSLWFCCTLWWFFAFPCSAPMLFSPEPKPQPQLSIQILQ